MTLERVDQPEAALALEVAAENSSLTRPSAGRARGIPLRFHLARSRPTRIGRIRRDGIRPDLAEPDVVAPTVSSDEHARTIGSPGSMTRLPSMRSKVEGLFLADTSHDHPREDRSISGSLRLGDALSATALPG